MSYPGGHTDGNEGQAQLRALIRNPRFASTVNDIVVAFGSSRHQDLMDPYIRGEDVAESAVRVAWLNAVQAGTALDNANTAAFFRNVREVNAALPPERKMRVLLSDPPMDWDNIRNKADFRKWVIQRDSYPADLVQREVLAHNRRALIVWANGHLMRQEIPDQLRHEQLAGADHRESAGSGRHAGVHRSGGRRLESMASGHGILEADESYDRTRHHRRCGRFQ